VRIEPEQYRTVGACLAAARGRANLTQTEAAERLGRKQTFLSEIERGLRRVDVLEIVLISRALDANPLQLFAEVTRSAEAELKVQKPQRPPKAGERPSVLYRASSVVSAVALLSALAMSR